MTIILHVPFFRPTESIRLIVDHSILLKLNHYRFCPNTEFFLSLIQKNQKFVKNLMTLCRDFIGYPTVFHKNQSLDMYCFYCMYTTFQIQNYTLFADDINSQNLNYFSISLLQVEVSQEITKVDSWLRKNKLSMNYKTKLIV